MTAHYPNIPGVCFKDVDGFPGYCVGDDGSVWSRFETRRDPVKGGFMGMSIGHVWRRLKARLFGHRNQSFSVSLARPGGGHSNVLIGRLVLTAFVGPCPPGMECCHGPDHDPANCRLKNLRWDTHANNVSDSVKLGRRCHGEASPFAKLTHKNVALIRRSYREGLANQPELARRFGVHNATINRIINQKKWICSCRACAGTGLAPEPIAAWASPERNGG